MHRRGFVNVDKTDALARGSSPFKLASEASSAGGLPPAFDAAVVFTSADYGHLEVAEEDATDATSFAVDYVPPSLERSICLAPVGSGILVDWRKGRDWHGEHCTALMTNLVVVTHFQDGTIPSR